ncbi:zinc finger protein 707-like [Heliangelus exortis]|uniref:zinc finger protein 707-like n=1 Tax=Heliangelus exortis TaxID=472823 RepID=UPI003A953366
MAGWAQDAVTFEDVAVYLSRAEWDTMGPGQRELYHRVMMENYNLLSSLGYPGPKPDILCRMERGEEPWVSAAQSPVRWDGPRRPSPGREGDGGWLEEPSWWWDGGGGRAQERTQPPDPGESWCSPAAS